MMVAFRTILVMFFVLTGTTSNVGSTEQNTYVVYMDKTKMRPKDDSTTSTSRSIYEAMLSRMKEEARAREEAAPEVLYVYETAISGFAAKLSEEQLKSVERVKGFLAATPDEMVSLHTTRTPQFMGLQKGEGLWSDSNLRSSDVIIGLVDSGIWPEHASFRDDKLSPVPSNWKGTCEQGTRFSPSDCNRKLIGARAFFKGYEELAGRINETKEYRSARDSEGHGTHTASTAAGNVVEGASFLGLARGQAIGISYTARIAAYKACWALGCASSDLVAAIDQAVADGVHVLSLSLGGSPKPYYSDGIAIASFGAIGKGILVSCSAGNSGPRPSTVSNAAPWIMTVAASYLDRSFPATVKLKNGNTFKGSSLYTGTKSTKRLPLYYGKGLAKYCLSGTLSAKQVKGKMVVCEQGFTSAAGKGEQVRLSGGAAMIVLNSGQEILADAYILPATNLKAPDAEAIRKYMNTTKKPTASISFRREVYGENAPVMAAFSSRGPSAVGPDLIKPDLTAPGVHILAAWPPNTSPTQLKTDNRSVAFNIISGTSMSCPHVSGVAALLKYRAGWSSSPAAIKSAMMTTAYTEDAKKSPIGDVAGPGAAATPFVFGSGHVDPEGAADPGLVYDIAREDYLNYLCGLNYTSAQIGLFSAGSNFSCPPDIDNSKGSYDLNYPSFAVIFNGTSTRVYTRTVTNVGTASSTYVVKVKEPVGVSVTVEPATLYFRKIGEKVSYEVRVGQVGSTVAAGVSSFGSLEWVSGKRRVKSPIAVTWK